MHVVEEYGEGANVWIRSLCRRHGNSGLRGAYGAASEWSADELGYPDCQRCPWEGVL